MCTAAAPNWVMPSWLLTISPVFWMITKLVTSIEIAVLVADSIRPPLLIFTDAPIRSIADCRP